MRSTKARTSEAQYERTPRQRETSEYLSEMLLPKAKERVHPALGLDHSVTCGGTLLRVDTPVHHVSGIVERQANGLQTRGEEYRAVLHLEPSNMIGHRCGDAVARDIGTRAEGGGLRAGTRCREAVFRNQDFLCRLSGPRGT